MAKETMKTKARYVELDLLRTIAILGMVIYHVAYDLRSFYGWDIDVFSGGWRVFQISIASLFLFLVGITSTFTLTHVWKRFATIGAAALLVSAVTFVVDPETYVRFGILHLIALSSLLIALLNRFRMWLLIPAVILIALPHVATFKGHALLIPLGFPPHPFLTVDYFPLIPWFGVVLIGFAIAPWLLQKMHKTGPLMISWPGKHSLLIYLIHQPIIIAILWLILGRPSF